MRISPRRYRNKETGKTVEAIVFLNMDMGHDIAAWCGGRFLLAKNPLKEYAHIELVPESENVTYRAYPGDYVVRDIENDTFFIVAAKTFREQYNCIDLTDSRVINLYRSI